MPVRLALALVIALVAAAPARALNLDTVVFYSPFTDQPFDMISVPLDQVMGDALADMG
jgi:hypothetical protein